MDKYLWALLSRRSKVAPFGRSGSSSLSPADGNQPVGSENPADRREPWPVLCGTDRPWAGGDVFFVFPPLPFSLNVSLLLPLLLYQLPSSNGKRRPLRRKQLAVERRRQGLAGAYGLFFYSPLRTNGWSLLPSIFF